MRPRQRHDASAWSPPISTATPPRAACQPVRGSGRTRSSTHLPSRAPQVLAVRCVGLAMSRHPAAAGKVLARAVSLCNRVSPNLPYACAPTHSNNYIKPVGVYEYSPVSTSPPLCPLSQNPVHAAGRRREGIFIRTRLQLYTPRHANSTHFHTLFTSRDLILNQCGAPYSHAVSRGLHCSARGRDPCHQRRARHEGSREPSSSRGQR